MKKPQYEVYVGDFETTVYEGQQETEVWASALVKIGTEDVSIFHSIDDTWEYLCGLAKKKSIKVYYHNLKFDGTFWIDYFLRKLKLPQAVEGIDTAYQYWEGMRDDMDFKITSDKDMRNGTFKYTISDLGQWYSILVKMHGHMIMFVDSLKLLPFSVRKIGKDFKTKHQKLDMQYKGYRYAGCTITDEEKQYIANDVLVVKEALEIMFAEGHDRLTIGSCCLAEFSNLMGRWWMKENLPDLSLESIDSNLYGSSNVDEYIRKSYRGGWCYVVKGKENTMHGAGCTVDVNSLYPSVMSGESGNKYPLGHPTFWRGNYIPDEAQTDHTYFFVRFRASFHLKKDKLPTVQLKNVMLYKGNEYLETSDWYNPATKKYQSYYYDSNGIKHDAGQQMTMTETDYRLFLEQYDVENMEILDGCYFWAEVGIFDAYIEKYKQMKMTSKGARRQIAKLFLNNLYGKLASSKDSSYKVAVMQDDGKIAYVTAKAQDKKIGYIPCGSAITSYARYFTITHAQNNYYGKNKPGFIYADTDSLHLDIQKEQLKDIRIHPTDFLAWKVESEWDYAKFIRQKTYMEHITVEDGEVLAEPKLSIKCAGMPERSKEIFLASVTGNLPKDLSEYSEEEIKYMKTTRTPDDFAIGMQVSGKLLPQRIIGGTILVDTYFTMK